MKKRNLNRGLLAAAVSLAFGNAWANPTGPTVARGAALLSNPNATTLQIVNTPGTIINWQGFSISAGELTRFIQDSAASAVLNRVTGSAPSSILGQLRSNGRVFLVNPNGIVFGTGSVVDVSALIASTRDIGDADFLAGNYLFSGAGNGTIAVQGGASITTATAGSGGTVWLFAKDVTVAQGASITAPQGQVVLAAGTQVTVGDSSLGNMSFTVNTGGSDSIQSLGAIAASQGAVGLFADFVNHTGSITTDQGKIAMNATRDLTIRDNASVIAANGTINLRGGNKLEIERLASVWADGASGAITLESNDLRIYPWADTLHANGGTVNYILTDPGTLQLGTALELDSNGPGYSDILQTGVYLLPNGNVEATWFRSTWNAAAFPPPPPGTFTMSSAVFSPSGSSLGAGGVVGSGNAWGGTDVDTASLPPPPANVGSREPWGRFLGGSRSWPTSDGGKLGPGAAQGTWTRLKSDGTALHTFSLPEYAPGVALTRLQSAIPLADGTVFALYLKAGNNTFGRRISASGTVIGSDVQLNTSPLNVDFTGFGTKDGGAVVLSSVASGGGGGGTYVLSATQFNKVAAPYAPSNNLMGTVGAVTGGIVPGNGTATPVVQGSGSGASVEVSGCNASVCSPELQAAISLIGAERALRQLAQGASDEQVLEGPARDAILKLQAAADARRRDLGADAAEAGVIMKDYGQMQRLTEEVARFYDTANPQQVRDTAAATKVVMENFIRREIVIQELGVYRSNPDEMTIVNSMLNMSEEQQTKFMDAVVRQMRRGDL